MQLRSNYAELGHQVKENFTDLVQQLNEQRSENDRLRNQIVTANLQLRDASVYFEKALENTIVTERAKATQERAEMFAQISGIFNANAEAQQMRLETKLTTIGDELAKARSSHEEQEKFYADGMDMLQVKADDVVASVTQKAELTDAALQADYKVSFCCNNAIHNSLTP